MHNQLPLSHEQEHDPAFAVPEVGHVAVRGAREALDAMVADDYASWFQPAEPSAEQIQDQQKREAYERQVDPLRARKLFAPLEKPKVEEEEPSYDYLFGNGPEPPEPKPKPMTTERTYLATEKTRIQAMRRLSNALNSDARLREKMQAPLEQIDAEHAGEQDYNRMLELVDKIRTDPETRYEAGVCLLGELNYLADSHRGLLALPRRVIANTGKTPDKGPKPVAGMTSREYVALLGLQMIDGTFDADLSSSDPIEANDRNPDGLGQHRYAAAVLLHGFKPHASWLQ